MTHKKPNLRENDYPLPSGPLQKSPHCETWLTDPDGCAYFLGGSILNCRKENLNDTEFRNYLNRSANCGHNFLYMDTTLDEGDANSLTQLHKRVTLAARRGFYVAIPLAVPKSLKDRLSELNNILWIEPDSEKQHTQTSNCGLTVAHIAGSNFNCASDITTPNRPLLLCCEPDANDYLLPWKALCSGMSFASTKIDNEKLSLAAGAAATLASRLPLSQMSPEKSLCSSSFCLAHSSGRAFVSLSCNELSFFSISCHPDASAYRFEIINPLTGYVKILPQSNIKISKSGLTAEFNGVLCVIAI